MIALLGTLAFTATTGGWFTLEDAKNLRGVYEWEGSLVVAEVWGGDWRLSAYRTTDDCSVECKPRGGSQRSACGKDGPRLYDSLCKVLKELPPARGSAPIAHPALKETKRVTAAECPLSENGKKLAWKDTDTSLVSWPEMGPITTCYVGSDDNALVVQSGGTDKRTLLQIFAPAVDPPVQNALGFRALQKKDYAAARAHFQNALTLNRKDDLFYTSTFNLVCTLALSGEPFAAAKPHVQALLATPDLKKKFTKKLKTDADLTAWRQDADFKASLEQ